MRIFTPLKLMGYLSKIGWSKEENGEGNCNDDEVVYDNEVVITKGIIEKAEQVLIDNGIEKDEACVVLQALGYVLFDGELYPEPI